MRFDPANAAVIGATLICWLCATLAEPLPDTGQTVISNPTIGHLQPRAPKFLPHSAAEQAEQKREADFDAIEEKQDIELDKRLNICRCGEKRPAER